MGLLIFAYRKQDIIRRKSDIEFKLLGLTKKLQDLQSYGATIADGTVSVSDMMSCPPSLFNRMTMYMMYSDQAARGGAAEKYELMRNMPGAIQQMPSQELQQQYCQMLFKNLQEQELEKFKKVEEKILNAQDKQISQEKAKLDTQLAMLEEELKSVDKAEGNAIKDSTPKFGLG